ncbi:MAG: RNA polymerase sigma factor [Lachnospiraceae bacterium]|nr:RNA polymerase sigma factor [Lachnospiraceae bacterium]
MDKDREKETDEVLYKRFLVQRREEDLAILLDRHKDGLILFLNGYVHNLDDAEELTLDAFAQAASGRSLFAGKSSFRTWLYSIGKNKALMYLRKKRPHVTLSEAGELSTGHHPELELIREEQFRALYLAMEDLKEDYRRILFLLYFEEVSYDEAARIMGKSKKQVYHLAQRGKDALKTTLERNGFEI